MSRFTKSILIALVIVIIDQISKFWIKTNMTLYENIPVFGNWFIIHFIENKGMAFGWEFFPKWVLSMIRIIAVVGLIWFLRELIKKEAKPVITISISLITAGALGNIIDSAFYGMFFTESKAEVISVFTLSGGYESFLHGHVVDMLHFPIINGHFPEWFPQNEYFPFKGGSSFTFFSPVFNIADSSVTVGVVLLLIFRKKFAEVIAQPNQELENN